MRETTGCEGLRREWKLRIRRVVASFREGVTVLPCSTSTRRDAESIRIS